MFLENYEFFENGVGIHKETLFFTEVEKQDQEFFTTLMKSKFQHKNVNGRFIVDIINAEREPYSLVETQLAVKNQLHVQIHYNYRYRIYEKGIIHMVTPLHSRDTITQLNAISNIVFTGKDHTEIKGAITVPRISDIDLEQNKRITNKLFFASNKGIAVPVIILETNQIYGSNTVNVIAEPLLAKKPITCIVKKDNYNSLIDTLKKCQDKISKAFSYDFFCKLFSLDFKNDISELANIETDTAIQIDPYNLTFKKIHIDDKKLYTEYSPKLLLDVYFVAIASLGNLLTYFTDKKLLDSCEIMWTEYTKSKRALKY